MAQDTSLSGLRNQLVTSIYGRRLALAPGNSSETAVEYIVGPRDIRVQVDGVSSAGSTITSTSVATAIPPYGVTMVGATAASATTAYNLAAPVPGVRKVIFNPTTGQANIGTTVVGGAFVCSSASVTSTHGNIFLVGKGAYVDLIGLTTNLWGLLENLGITTVSTGNMVQLS